MSIFSLIQEVLNYGIDKKFIDKEDEIYSRNLILDCLNLDEWKDENIKSNDNNIEDLLIAICQWAVRNKFINNSLVEMELLDTKIMNCISPRPSEVIKNFYTDFKNSPELATKNYYNFSKNTNYIRAKRIEKNLHWLSPTQYGDLEITINLAKPEKDPKDIEREKNMPKSSYPNCLLCIDNVGYRGRLNHPARQTHRVIPMTLKNENWYFQFSPYVYYNEHSIIFCEEHRPMKMSKNTFDRLLEFVDSFPHYCIGSNADLPIVGGSILSHDHYQAGNHIFPMEKASIEKSFKIKKFNNVDAEIVNWPMSVIRLTSKDKEELSKATEYVFKKWQTYSDLSCDILAFTDNIPHNTVTPIARKVDNSFQIDLALRNNRCSDEHPMGIFHPHSDVHNIKKENIGLIEVMGLAILPGRLQDEMKSLEMYLNDKEWDIKLKNDPILSKHHNWAKNIMKNNSTPIDSSILKEEIGKVFLTVLEHAGVFKRDVFGKKAFTKFIDIL